MCIVIDANTLASVFTESDTNHIVFKPVRQWIVEGKGKVVYGGTKYIKELGRFTRLFIALKKAGKAVFVPNEIVDEEVDSVSAQITHTDFDDQHIVALLKISGCKLICSSDQRAYPFFRHNLFFTPAKNKPKIYSSAANATLLIDRNIADICLPCLQTTKAQRSIFEKI